MLRTVGKWPQVPSRDNRAWRTLGLGSGVLNINVNVAPGECFLEAAWNSSGVTGVESEQARCEPDSASNLLCHLRGLTQPL